jgi:hypothetical protein
MMGPKTRPEHRPKTCGECWAGPRGGLRKEECAKGGGLVGPNSKGCDWGLLNEIKYPGTPRLF